MKNLILIVTAAFMFVCLKASADEISGQCGDSVFWKIQDGVLIINGDGAMDTYTYSEKYIEGQRVIVTTAPYDDFKAGVKSIVVLPGVTSIGDYAFAFFESLTSVYLSKSVTTMGEYSLGFNNRLSTIMSSNPNPPSYHSSTLMWPEVNRITLSVPSGCSGIYKQKLPWRTCAEITEFQPVSGRYGDNHTFLLEDRSLLIISGNGRLSGDNPLGDYRSQIKTIFFSEGVTAIPQRAFESFTGVTEIIFPSTLDDIEAGAFMNCAALKSVNFSKVTELKVLKTGVFSNCGLVSLVLPENIKEIQSDCFSSCASLEKVIFPYDCDKIGSFAFSRCTSLKSLVFRGVPPSIDIDGDSTFSDVNFENVTVYVHDELLYWFQRVATWQAFKQILPLEELPGSHDATLKALTVTGNLTPLYSPDIYDYTVTVPYSVDSITVNAQKKHPLAIATGNDGTYPLNIGENIFKITVTAENRATVLTYTIKVTRAGESRDATLKSFTVTPGILSPSFSPNTTYYTVTVPDDTREILIELETTDSTSILDANYNSPGLKTLNPSLPNKYGFLVYTANHQNYKFYQLTVKREHGLGIFGISGDEIKVYSENKNLSIISPVSENINIYTVTGKLLHSLGKPSGKTSAVINYPERILIVKGSSGWSRKVINGVPE